MRKDNFATRLRLAFTFLIKYKKCNVRVMTCENCGSINIKEFSHSARAETFKDNWEEGVLERNQKIKRHWGDIVQCQECGATCMESQFWHWE